MGRADLVQASLAQRMGLAGASSLQRYLSDDSFKEPVISTKMATRLEKALVGLGSPPITRDEIWSMTGVPAGVVAPEREKPNAIIGDKIDGENVMVPVYGQAVGGVDGQFIMNGSILYSVMAPPQIAKISGAYGVLISGDSMSPRYEDGEIAFVDPRRRLKKGDYVVAQIQFDEHEPPHAYVKRFVRHNSEDLVLSQFNPPKELVFDHEQVVSVHYIALAGDA